MTAKEKENAPGTARLARLIGLAARAGRIRSGGFAAEESLRQKKACVCLLASDASDNTIKRFEDLCLSNGVPLMRTPYTKEALGHMIGRGERSSVTVEDQGFAESMLRLNEGGYACE